MDALGVLSAITYDRRVSAIPRVALALRARGCCSDYLTAFDRAIEAEPPPFGTEAYSELYHSASKDALWMAVSLITNAEREGDGAKRLWSLAACSSSMEQQALLRLHALDESRHALLYLALLDLALPGVTESSFRHSLKQLSPRYSPRIALKAVEGSPYAKEPSIDDFLQMNVAEIRTTIHHLLQRSALLHHCPADKREQIGKVLDSLLHDELHHVAYTGSLIDRLSQGVATTAVHSLFRKRLHDFNRITEDELGEHNFGCSSRCCAGHPDCRAKAAVSFIDAPI